MRMVSWNVNGIRAVMKKDFATALQNFSADLVCLQETKAQDEQVHEALTPINGYKLFCNSAARKGYSGTAILSKIQPISVQYDMGIDEHDQEGRVIAAEFESFYVVTVYTPNSGSELKRLEYRQQWDADFLSYLKELEKNKAVIVCGDLNVAHRDIDLARPKQNYNKSAGYTQAEINGLDNIVESGYIDTFRFLYPEKVKYSWWSYRAGARERNIGWRIDYFFVSEKLRDTIINADILNDITGSDHCPVQLDIKP